MLTLRMLLIVIRELSLMLKSFLAGLHLAKNIKEEILSKGCIPH